MNINARSVSPALAPIAKSIFGRQNVFVTKTEDEARQAAKHIAKHLDQYNLVVPVGGDGTLSSMITFLSREIGGTTTNESVGKLPLVGYIPLGTGNGVGSVVGCRVPFSFRRKSKLRRIRAILEALKEVAEHHPTPQEAAQQYDVVEMPMMEVTHPPAEVNLKQHEQQSTTTTSTTTTTTATRGDLCFFAGIGFDSLMLNDFKEIKAWSRRTGFLRGMLSSVMGYCVALVVRTLPAAVRGKHNIYVKLTSNDPDCVWVDHRRGDVVRPCPERTLYKGVTGILAAGTSPFYGGGLRLFPFARMTLDKMHVRLGRINPLVGFINIPKIFAGSYRDKSESFGVLDFIGSDFEVDVSSDTDEKGYPFQHSGESVGNVERFRLRVVKSPVRFVSFLKKRNET